MTDGEHHAYYVRGINLLNINCPLAVQDLLLTAAIRHGRSDSVKTQCTLPL